MFSAPNYRRELDNAGAVMTMDDSKHRDLQRRSQNLGLEALLQLRVAPFQKVIGGCLGEPWSFASGSFIARGFTSHLLSFPFPYK
uniref:Uncharacterized protein n=1 Tax=Salix viminalis TaxID=40686 RepID=A0A6N2N861_SALVM